MKNPSISSSPARAVALRCEHLPSPLGLDERRPRFSWQMRDKRWGARQSNYELIVEAVDGSGGAGRLLWSSGLVVSAETVLVPLGGADLQPHTRYRWRVRLHDHEHRAGAWSAWARFSTGFLGTSWPAEWIGARPPTRKEDSPAFLLRREFTLHERPQAAQLYVTALGLFEARLNGHKISSDVLTPGWTDYRRRVEYLTYDVTASLLPGQNALGLLLAEGWYSGRLAWQGQRWLYGKSPAVRAALRVVLADGRTQWIVTGRDWKWTTGPFLSASLYNGECYDARRELKDWDAPAFDDRAWEPARRPTLPTIEINAKQTPPIRATRELRTVAMHEPRPGVQLFDLGQNLVGVVRLRVSAPAGTKVRLRYGEMLNADRSLYTANLRSAAATDEYICRGEGEETYTPRFTFHGFRYVEVCGLPTRVGRNAITAVVFHSDLPECGRFRCSDPLINRLQENIVWGQRGNFLDLPTDCPQRDERLGWTGDAQIFARTAACNYDVTTFFHKWLRDLRDGQHANGSFPDVAPDALALAKKDKPTAWSNHSFDGNAAWGDAGVLCPWVIYQQSGDIRILADNYTAMVAWIDYQQRTSRNLLRPVTAYGDWLATDAVTPFRAPTPNDLIGTAYFARSTDCVAQIARLLGHANDAVRFERLHARVVSAFQHEYLSPAGKLAGDTQTGYLLALAFDLLPPRLRPRAVARLAELIEQNSGRLATGFVGTPLLCPTLSRFGRDDLAYALLFQREYPSWLYPVRNGATTMWERWNSWTKESGFGDVAMNSFNHYAYGAIGEWLYDRVGGIALDPKYPGYKQFRLAPAFSRALRFARAELTSPHGLIRSAWRLTPGRLHWEVTIPANTTATLSLPTTALASARVSSPSVGRARKFRPTTAKDGQLEIVLPSGAYQIEVRHPTLV